MRNFIIFFLLLFHSGINAQSISKKLQTAFQKFESDPQLRNAISSLYVIDGRTGKVIFSKNSLIGLAPASTQKIITSATAYELLGKDFRYQTYIGYDIGIENQELLGNLYFIGSGDPTLGSWRWQTTKEQVVFQKIVDAFTNNKIRNIRGDIWIDDLQFGINPVPDGWIWQDIGNYYGAGAWGFNWHENQYDLVLKGGYESSFTGLDSFPLLAGYKFGNFIKTGKKGSGDNGYIYFTPYSNVGFATGTVPPSEKGFTISGSDPHPPRQFGLQLLDHLKKEKIQSTNRLKIYSDSIFARAPIRKAMHILDSISSPNLDSMNFWFLTKSINLYGEAFLKTLAHKKVYTGSTEKGIEILKDFWKEKGIESSELNMMDGSGLSPLNRVTTHAQVMVLAYAKKQSWFNGYFHSFPQFNGIKMKSGTISGAKGFCGYHKSKAGQEYIFSFLVNNYNGSSSSVVQKM
ncbi:MAG: D-alanyl-D-alanine carboxypeptidase/D-alanyl-D-alanine endopeptidase, partial [Flavisolibacter sp.]